MQKKKKNVNDFERSGLQYCKDISHFEPLSKEEEIELWKDYKYNHNLDARDKLINANLKFVVNIASKYTGRGLSYADLISEGNMGLMKAIDKFDGAKGYKTITYSVWWIKQSILEAIDKRNGIEHEDLPMDTENSSLFDNDDVEAQPLLGDEFKEDSIESNLNKEDLHSSVETILSGLTKRERTIVEKYYGLTCDKPMTLEEIGKELKLTKERIRQINDKALKKMKSNALLNSITSDIYI